jgi:hypothetical protein
VRGAIWTPCSVSTRQIGATPKRPLFSAMNAQTELVCEEFLYCYQEPVRPERFDEIGFGRALPPGPPNLRTSSLESVRGHQFEPYPGDHLLDLTRKSDPCGPVGPDGASDGDQ